MFSLQEKPVFYNYPLSKVQQSYLNEKLDQLRRQTASMRVELAQIQQYGDREKYQQYRRRLREKMAILNEEIRESQRILDVHATIEREVRRKQQTPAQAKAKLLDHYKAVMMAKRSRKMIDEWKDRQLQKRLLIGETIDQQADAVYLGQAKFVREVHTERENPELERQDELKRDLVLPTIFSPRAKISERKFGNKSGLYYQSIHRNTTKNQSVIQANRKGRSCIIPF